LITRPLKRYKVTEKYPKKDYSVAIVIVFKNGGDYLKKILPELLKQDYANFKLWLADDFSTDEGPEFVQNYAENDARIQYYKVQHDKPGKKQALRELIPHIESDILLFTDVDWVPSTKQWISRMVSSFQDGIDIVLEYSPMLAGLGFINMFSRFETLITAIHYFSWTLWGQSYMGVGRNFAYRHSLYSDEAYKSKFIGGDDDLFIQQKASPKNVAIQIHPNTFMYTEAKSDFKSFIQQKKRHVSTSFDYKWKHQFILSLFGFSQILFYPLAILLLLSNTHIYVLSLLVLIRMSLYYFSAKDFMSKFEEYSLFCRVFILDLALSVYYLVIGIVSLFKKKQTWN
jgi:glycosyltransferase involved in cell wall biosynthesis